MSLNRNTENSLEKHWAHNSLLQKVLEVLPVGVWIIDRDGKVVHGNPAGQCLWAGARFVGIDQYGEYKGWRLDTGKKIEPSEWAAARAIQKGETTIDEEVEIECFDGTRKIMLHAAVPVKNEQQEIVGAIVVNQDITQRKKAEKTLIDQSRILEAFFSHTITPLAILDRKFNFIRVNEAYAKAGQRDVSEFPGHNHFDFYPSDARVIFEQVVETKKPYQTIARPFVYPDHPEWGVTYWDWTLTPLLDNRNEVEFLVFSLEDATERKKAEQQIVQQNELLNNILEALTHPFYVVDVNDYTIQLANSAARLAGQSGATTCHALSHQRELPCEGEDHPCVITKIREAKTSVTVEHTHYDKDRTPRIIEVHGYPIFDNRGNIIQVIEYNLDITERKRAVEALGSLNKELEQRVKARTAELENANIRLKELDRMKSMFIASMSHELRTPLNSIIGFSSILLNEWTGPLNAEQKEDLSAIWRSGRHLLNLINDVIDVSKIEAGKIDSVIESFNLHDVIEEAVNFFTKEINEKKLSLTVEAVHQEMHSDRRRLLQCVLNLLSNAVKFTEKGSIRVSVRSVRSDESYEKSPLTPLFQSGGSPPLAKGDEGGFFIEISVADTGIGIREEDCPELFNAFVRLDSPTRALIPGTGLGLYLTKKLVAEVLKGDILLSSRYGEGSTFTIIIPARIDEKGLGN